MVKLSDYDHLKNYSTADRALGDRDSKVIGNNTELVRRNPSKIVVELHGHGVVEYNRGGPTRVSSAGYKTATTKDRLNRYTPSSFKVVQRDFEWMVKDGRGERRFQDGMEV